jgi:uncharacterized membrane protein HdeD (DUF308 family)
MSEPNTAGPSEQPRYTWGQITVIAIGVILLLPGLCSLFVMVSMVPWNISDPFFSLVATVWMFGLLISAGGAWMIYAARKRTKEAG